MGYRDLQIVQLQLFRGFTFWRTFTFLDESESSNSSNFLRWDLPKCQQTIPWKALSGFDTLFQLQQHPARDAHDTNVRAEANSFPPDYLERVKKMHAEGGNGSIG